MLNTGMRPGEIFRLERRDVDIESASADHHVRAENTKSQRSRRITMNAELLDVMHDWLATGAGDRFVFPSPRNPKAPIATVKKAWAGLVAASGITDIELYDLRAYVCVHPGRKRADIKSISQLLGHIRHRDDQTHYASCATESWRDRSTCSTKGQ